MDYKDKIIALLDNEELSQELREKLEGILSEFEEGKDERTRKAILAGLIDCKDSPDLGWSNFGGVNIDECIAWIERQGEQTHAELNQSEVIKTSEQELEPKFYIGVWIVDNKMPNDVFCVIDVLEEIYKVVDTDGNEYHIPHCKADKQFHLWSITDAKAGDVLASTNGNDIVIFKQLDSDESFSSYYNIRGQKESEWSRIRFIPATKKQRDFLFQKMKETGYEWNSEKNELKKNELKKIKMESKFHEGEWIIVSNDNYIYQVKEVKESIYVLRDLLSDEILTISIDAAERLGRRWTIQDAKDCDILTYKNDDTEWILIYKTFIPESHDVPHDVLKYRALFTGTDFYDSGVSAMIDENCASCFTPATNEQRDLLFQKMENAGYEWDAVKKTLRKKVESKTLDPDKVITEAYCSSKVAKLFKEKGFNVPVWTRYEGEEDKDVVFGDKYDWNNDTRERTSAPTHQMALKWLRETHKISIEVFACCDKHKDGKIWSYTICKIYDAANEIGPSISYYTTYEEAVEAALTYCLKEIL